MRFKCALSSEGGLTAGTRKVPVVVACEALMTRGLLAFFKTAPLVQRSVAETAATISPVSQT